jgi:hypothetical protein
MLRHPTALTLAPQTLSSPSIWLKYGVAGSYTKLVEFTGTISYSAAARTLHERLPRAPENGARRPVACPVLTGKFGVPNLVKLSSLSDGICAFRDIVEQVGCILAVPWEAFGDLGRQSAGQLTGIRGNGETKRKWL